MSLDEKLVQKKKIIVRTPSGEILSQIEKGNTFVVVEQNFDHCFIPHGFTLIDMKYKGDSFKALVPQSLLFYMANPGEGDIEDALDEISNFYGNAEDYEHEAISNGHTSVQETNWATIARNSYKTYLINKLVKNKKGEWTDDGEPVPEFDSATISALDLDDRYVKQRVEAIAALCLGKTGDQLKKYDIEGVLKHVRLADRKEQLTKKEFDKITCWAGSHYEIKDEYRNTPEKYSIERRHDTGHKVGTKMVPGTDLSFIDSQVAQLEKEIEQHRARKHEVGRHDTALIREYANLAYIARENPKAQLDIQPPEKQPDE